MGFIHPACSFLPMQSKTTDRMCIQFDKAIFPLEGISWFNYARHNIGRPRKNTKGFRDFGK